MLHLFHVAKSLFDDQKSFLAELNRHCLMTTYSKLMKKLLYKVSINTAEEDSK